MILVKRGIGILVIMFAILMVATTVSAQTLNFEQSATSGNVLNGKIDIVKIGGYAQGDYQYFYVVTKDSGINSPPSNSVYTLTIAIEAKVDGKDVTDYVDIVVTWTNDNGNVKTQAIFTTSSGGMSTLGNNDLIVSGNKVTVRVPATLFQDVTIYNVEFTTLGTGGQFAGDQVTYYPNSSSSGGGGNNGNGGGEITEDHMSPYMLWLGPVASIACVAIWFIIWILIALWAYKDAKKKCNEHPGLWFVVVLLLGLIGIIIYVIVVKDECNKQQVYVPPPPS